MHQHALEVTGLAALEAEDYETALSIFRGLSIDLNAQEPVRTREPKLLRRWRRLVKQASISTGELQIDDLLDAVGAPSAGCWRKTQRRKPMKRYEATEIAPDAPHEHVDGEVHDHNEEAAVNSETDSESE